MTDKEKAREIGIIHARQYRHNFSGTEFYSNEECIESAMEMATWKEQQMIDYIYNHAHVTTFGDIRLEKCSVAQFIEDFKKAVEE